jgi:hypothetical protein
MRQSYDTNKCENVMKVITKYHPKDMMFYETCIAKARILAAIGKDLIGLLGYLEMEFERLGIRMLETTREFGRVNDFESTYNKDHKKTSASKMKRAVDKSEKLRTLYKDCSYRKWHQWNTVPVCAWKWIGRRRMRKKGNRQCKKRRLLQNLLLRAL